MAQGDVMGVGMCSFCGYDKVKMIESKNQGAAGTCPECGAQTFGKTPKAAAALRSRQTPAKAGVAGEATDSFGAAIFGEGK